VSLKCKFFSWLAIQIHIWTADRLAARNWPHEPTCALCRVALESGLHLFVECRFTKRIWEEVAVWVAVEGLKPSSWHWWEKLGFLSRCNRKGIRSLLILVNWEIWREKNARIFYRRFSSCQQIIAKIKSEAAAWNLAGAKHLATPLTAI
jgi:hypothetical protein